jgi:hypothetical protein
MSTARDTWKAAERRVAETFGTKRQRCSGSSGREDETRSDSVHPRLYIEAKLRERHSTRTLYDETRKLAVKEKKLPVLALFDKHRPGFLVVIHSDDMRRFALEITPTAEQQRELRSPCEENAESKKDSRPSSGLAMAMRLSRKRKKSEPRSRNGSGPSGPS